MRSFFAPLFALIQSLFLAVYSRSGSHKKVHNSAQMIRKLLNPAGTPIALLLRARAAPNQRLVHAFGITSTFVSADPEIHRDFVATARKVISRLSVKGEGWKMFSQAAEDAVTRLLQNEQVEYDVFMQCVTFMIVLIALFDVDPDLLHLDDLVFVTSKINMRWADSKKNDITSLAQDDSLDKMRCYLERWIDQDQHPNPLNLILPAYETMWRVVAVTVAHVHCYGDNNLREVVLKFADRPTEEQFESLGEEGMSPSMKGIVTEVLRLHPPTKRIAREIQIPWWKRAFVPSLEIADVQAAHLSPIYGENTAAFEPTRFHSSRSSEQPTLFSFGYGKLSCPAASWAPMGAALIVGKVMQGMDRGRYGLAVGPRIGDRSGWNGWSIKKMKKPAGHELDPEVERRT
ncbi:hypothetical protein ID866_2097 [Astraeus odoratus]|nr:hypothetical protein ID866_2097 [Astraeus odoratus]